MKGLEKKLSEDLNMQPQKPVEDEMIQELRERLQPAIRRALDDLGFTKLTPIQENAIPALLAGEDVIGQAQTGTGKTAAFGIPLIQNVDPHLRKLQAIVLCPTRELAIQAALELRKIAKYIEGLKVLPVYGGQDITRQIKALGGVQIVVGTPGRVMDHMRRHTIKLTDVRMAVLDEADEMLNMGFREDMEVILGEIPGEHQTALFSATMPQPILEIAGRFQKDARHIRVAAKELTVPLIEQKYYMVRSQDKDAATVRLLEYYQPKLCLIFCNTKAKVDELSEVLKKRGFQAEGLHGDLIQHQRDIVMGRFRGGVTNILIATDVAARGIDVENVEIVINYDIPQDVEYYVHRIGRTGRAGRTGLACTLATSKESYKIREIERTCHTELELKKLPDPSKVLRVKALGFLDHAWEQKDEDDIELMKVYLRRKLEKEECDIMDLAACMLRTQIGGKDREIPEDKPEQKKRFGLRGLAGKNTERGGRQRISEHRGNQRISERGDKQKISEYRGSHRNSEHGDKQKTSERGEKQRTSERGRKHLFRDFAETEKHMMKKENKGKRSKGRSLEMRLPKKKSGRGENI